MFLTHDILAQYNACAEGLDWFDRHYPNGAEVLEVMQTRHIPLDILHWGMEYLPTSIEAQQLYLDLVHIQNSNNVFKSDNIQDSNFISESHKVTNSNYIYESQDITNSNDIYKSNKITDSAHISDSIMVYTSQNIVQSSNIKLSNTVLDSHFIIESNNVFNSSLITRSNIILHCTNIMDSMFMTECKDCHHCLFCSKLNNQAYQIFNHSISQEHWDFIYQELTDILSDYYLHFFDEWNCEDPDHGIRTYYSPLIWFQKLTDISLFINWVQSLFYYDNKIMYRLTFNPMFIQQKEGIK